MIDIVISTNNRFAQHSGVMLTSLFENNKNESFSIHVLFFYLSVINKKDLELIVNHYGHKLFFYKIQSDYWENLQQDRIVTSEAYNRLLIPELLPYSVMKALYLDSDIIVNGEISELWNIDIEKYSAAVVVEKIPEEKNIFKRIGCEGNEYFNSGVLLLNLAFFRMNNLSYEVRRMITNYGDKLSYYDQDILNVVFNKTKRIIPEKWNYVHGKNGIDKKNNEIAVLIHYIGPIKPWHWGCKHISSKLYTKYLSLTPWKDFKPTFWKSIKDLKWGYYVAYLMNMESVYFHIGQIVKSCIKK